MDTDELESGDCMEDKTQHVFCSVHNKETTFLCTECNHFICDKCVESNHSRHTLKALPRPNNLLNYYDILAQRTDIFLEVLKVDLEEQIKAIDTQAENLIDVVHKIRDATKEAILSKNKKNIQILKQVAENCKQESQNAQRTNFCLSSTFSQTVTDSTEEVQISRSISLIKTTFVPAKINVMLIKQQIGRLSACDREINFQTAFLEQWPRLHTVRHKRTKTPGNPDAERYHGMSSDSELEDFEFLDS